jgi:hypothetical protein
MSKYTFRTDNRTRKERAEGFESIAVADTEQCQQGRNFRVNRNQSPFSLSIRTDDGRTLLETRVEHMHQAFQRLIDWSIGKADDHVCASISGPNGFRFNRQIKAPKDFTWIENDRNGSDSMRKGMEAVIFPVKRSVIYPT